MPDEVARQRQAYEVLSASHTALKSRPTAISVRLFKAVWEAVRTS